MQIESVLVRAAMLATLALQPFTLGGMLANAEPSMIYVSPSGSASYRTLQEALDHAPATGGTVIVISPGVYHEKLIVKTKGIILVGAGQTAEDVVITNGDSVQSTGGKYDSGTVVVQADGFAAENLTIRNSWWDEHSNPKDTSQALALSLTSDMAVLDRVRLVSGQDTLFANGSSCSPGNDPRSCHSYRQLFNDCFIEGHVDYIYGNSRAVFNKCELHSRAQHTVMITAQGNNVSGSDSGYFFLHCQITGRDDGDRLYLGRPWREYASVLFYDTEIKLELSPEGWLDWGGRLKTSTYREYNSHGIGANLGHRVVDSPPLSKEEELNLTSNALLGGTGQWNPEAVVETLRHYAAASMARQLADSEHRQ